MWLLERTWPLSPELSRCPSFLVPRQLGVQVYLGGARDLVQHLFGRALLLEHLRDQRAAAAAPDVNWEHTAGWRVLVGAQRRAVGRHLWRLLQELEPRR